MSEKTFKSELFGLNKKEVEEYVKDLKADYEIKLKKLKEEKGALELKTNELLLKEEEVNKKSELVSIALIKAEEQARQIVDDAMESAKKERAQIDEQIEQEKEDLIDVKREVICLKENVKTMLQEFMVKLDELEKAVNNTNA